VAIDALDDAVLGVLLADATLMTLLPGKVYLDEAPEGVEVPYGVMTLQVETVTLEQGGTAFVTALYDVKVEDRANTKTAAQAALDRIDALLNHVTLAPVGFTQMASHRTERRGGVRREGPLLWQERGAVYEVWASPGLS
jgi:hypothetical protein